MENPLTEELIEELNEIIQLPREEQSLKLKDFFKKLTSEQIEFLKKHQTQQCIFCGIALGQIDSYKIYEDDDVVAALDINPANKGHVLIIPKLHLKYTYEIPIKLFEVTNLVSKRIKEILNCDTSIIVNNGEDAGENFSHVIINVIPRKKDDKLNFNWNFKKIDENELNELTSKLKFQVKKEEKVREEIKERQPYRIRRIP
ncbi:MAG: HIT family protein [Nanoarchaeota archaeon]